MATLLFIVHPNFAVDAWQTRNKKAQLTTYLESVLDAINSHQGPVAVTVMPPYTILNKTADNENCQIHEDFLKSLSQTKANVYHEDQYASPQKPLGQPVHHLIDKLFLANAVDRVTFAGGYFQSCLRETWQTFRRAYEKYCLDNGIQVDINPELTLLAGTQPKTLAQAGQDKTVTTTNTYISWS